MKKALLFLLIVLGTLMELMEVLLLPILFLAFGIWQQMPWQYYAITIGGYFALFLIGELVIHLIFKALNKKYASRLVVKVEKMIARFSKEK